MVNEITKRERKISLGLVIVGLIVAVGIIYWAFYTGPEVSAQGDSEIDAQPDEISVNIVIETKNATSAGAQEQNSLVKEKTIAALKKAGFKDEDIKYVSYYSQPWYEWTGNTNREKGFIVYQQIAVKTQDFQKVQKVVEAAIEGGALVQSIQMELSKEKQNEYKTEALEEASKNAREKARAIATGQGRRLGRLIELQNNEFSYHPTPYYTMKSGLESREANVEARDAASSIQASPEDIKVTARVNARYRMGMF